MNALNLLWAFELTSTEGSVNKKGTLPVDLENYCTVSGISSFSTEPALSDHHRFAAWTRAFTEGVYM